MSAARVHSALRRWRTDESGTISVEALFWLILVLGAIALVFDSTAMFHSESRILRASHDANRNLSSGRFYTEAEVESFIANELRSISANVIVEATISNHIVTTRVTVPASDLGLFGFLQPLSQTRMNVITSHYIEDYGT